MDIEKFKHRYMKALDDSNYKLYYLEQIQKLISECVRNEKEHRDAVSDLYEIVMKEQEATK